MGVEGLGCVPGGSEEQWGGVEGVSEAWSWPAWAPSGCTRGCWEPEDGPAAAKSWGSTARTWVSGQEGLQFPACMLMHVYAHVSACVSIYVCVRTWGSAQGQHANVLHVCTSQRQMQVC